MIILTETDMKVNGGVGEGMVMVHSLIKMEVSMLGDGSIIKTMVGVHLPQPMEVSL